MGFDKMIIEIYDNQDLEKVDEIKKDYIKGEVYDFTKKQTSEFEAVRHNLSDEFKVKYYGEPSSEIKKVVKYSLDLLESDISLWGHIYNDKIFLEWNPYQLADFQISGISREVELPEREYLNMIDKDCVYGIAELSEEYNVSADELIEKAVDCIGWSVEGFNSAISLEEGKMDVWQWTSGTVIEKEERETFIWEVSSSDFDDYPQPSDIEDLLVVWIENYQN